MILRFLTAAAFCLLSSCAPAPRYYTIAPQHEPPAGEEVVGFGEFVLSAQPTAESHFIKDVKSLEGSSWRWTLAEPEFRFFLKSARNRIFRLEMGINDVTFKDTGPVRMQIFVNGQLLDEPVFGKPGEYQYERPAPQRMLKENTENRVIVKVLNPWISTDPGVRLGFLLFGAGFITQ